MVSQAAVQALETLYDRPLFTDLEYGALVFPMCQPENVARFQNLYLWSVVGIEGIDSPRHLISKKLSVVSRSLSVMGVRS